MQTWVLSQPEDDLVAFLRCAVGAQQLDDAWKLAWNNNRGQRQAIFVVSSGLPPVHSIGAWKAQTARARISAHRRNAAALRSTTLRHTVPVLPNPVTLIRVDPFLQQRLHHDYVGIKFIQIF